MTNLDPDIDLEKVTDEKHGRLDSTGAPFTEQQAPSLATRILRRVTGNRPNRTMGEIIGVDDVNRLGEHETEAVVDEIRGLAPHQVGSLSDQAPKPAQPEAPRQPGEGKV